MLGGRARAIIQLHQDHLAGVTLRGPKEDGEDWVVTTSIMDVSHSKSYTSYHTFHKLPLQVLSTYPYDTTIWRVYRLSSAKKC
jgi:hypothetical protein